MSLDFCIKAIKPTIVYSGNITHNLAKMAGEAGIYECLWRPDEHGYERAKDLIKPLTRGILMLAEQPEHFKQFEPDNKWGTYEGLLEFAKEVLDACKAHPEGEILISR